MKNGESTDKFFQEEKMNVKLKIHICEANSPPFVTKLFKPLYLCIKYFEIELTNSEKIDISVRMQNDISNSNSLKSVGIMKRNVYGGSTLILPITNKDDTYFIDAFYSDSNKIYSSNEYDTKDLEPYTIYRIDKNNMKFWAQIVNEGESEQFNNKKYDNYYNQLPTEYYMVYLEFIEFSEFILYDSKSTEIYYTMNFGSQYFKSRKFYSNKYLIFNDEYKLKGENLEEKIHFDIMYNGNYKEKFDIDLTSHEFGKIVEETYVIRKNPKISAKIKWQVTEPCQPRWEERIIKLNSLNLYFGSYKSHKNTYEFWQIKFENIKKNTIITPCGAFEETYSFILTNQTKIEFIQYVLDSDNFSKENKKIDVNISDLKNNEPFCINEDLTGLIEIVPYKTQPFQGKIFPRYFYPKSLMSVAILITEASEKFDFEENLYIGFKFKDRTCIDQKSMKISKYNDLIWNQYFNFDVKSFRDDVLEFHIYDNKKELGKEEIKISSLISSNESNKCSVNTEKGNIYYKIQLVPPNMVPFSEFKFEIEKLFIQILYGENIKTGDLFCQCRLINDLTWIKTNVIKNSQNPQWSTIIELPICNLSDYVELEVYSSGLISNTKLGYYKLGLEEISEKVEKKTIKLNQGLVHFLILRTKNLELQFYDYKEEDKKITAEKATVAVKIIGMKNKIESFLNSSVYCLLKLGDEEQKTRCVDYNYYPNWNELFYFSLPSFATSELSIKILNKLSKNNVLYEINIPIKDMEPGIVKESNDNYLKMITQLIGPGENSFEEDPFKIKNVTVRLESLEDNKNKYCMIKLKGDEYWRYTKFGKFIDFFTFEYIDQKSLIIKTSDGQNYSEEISFDLDEAKEEVIKNSLGKYKINFIDKVIFDDSNPVLTFNLHFQGINIIKKEEDVFWIAEINNISTGYTFDGNFDKYFSFPINSLLSDEYNIVLYKEKKGKKKEYGKSKILINQFKIGIMKSDKIIIEDLYFNFSGYISLPNKIPFENIEYYPLIMHICVIEAYNLPSKSDYFVLCRLERDQSGATTKALEKTSTPQWYEFISFIITDENEDLIVEIRSKNGKKSKLISETKLNLKKYLDGEIYYEWLKMDKAYLNIALQVKKENEKYMQMDDIYNYIDSSIPDNN